MALLPRRLRMVVPSSPAPARTATANTTPPLTATRSGAGSSAACAARPSYAAARTMTSTLSSARSGISRWIELKSCQACSKRPAVAGSPIAEMHHALRFGTANFPLLWGSKGCTLKPLHRMKFIAVIGMFAVSAAVLLAAPVDYVKEIKPLLREQCYQCHGATQPKHGLRLDTAASALKGGKSGPAIKPGKSSDSLLVQVISGPHKDITRMPYKKPPLVDAQIALLRRWIDEGAQAPAGEQADSKAHWAFVAPKRPILPEVQSLPAVNHRTSDGRPWSLDPGTWTQNPIDRFVLARLAQEKLSPSPEADRPTLIRRLSLDLLGLPPKPVDVDAFVNDMSLDAYEKLVERLLASPHYGERWGRWWLDVARYSDSNGYSIDAPRNIWRYRDWV
ncbi:MAG: DUF1549 domain-containing protein, partial [Verrucomicrobia bacterium]|nr:DUF1549 domain-containing protein [Verrucomicrobiota bacterium]